MMPSELWVSIVCVWSPREPRFLPPIPPHVPKKGINSYYHNCSCYYPTTMFLFGHHEINYITTNEIKKTCLDQF